MIRRRSLVLVVGLIAATVLILGVIYAFSQGDLSKANSQDREQANSPYSPPTGLDTRAPLPPPGAVGGTGVIEPRQRPLELSVEVAGIIASIEVTEGEHVDVDDVLLTLRNGTALALLEAARGDESAARAELRSASGGSRLDDIAAAMAEATAAESRAALSASTARRFAKLYAQDGISASENEQAQQTAEADAGAARAAAARRSAVAASKNEATRTAMARLSAAVARREQAERAVEQLTMHAPIAGEVLAIRFLPGEFASPGTSGAIVLGDTSTLRARIDISERDATYLEPGQPAKVLIEGYDEPLPGKVVSVARQVGRKNVRSDDPTDRRDQRFIETLVELDEAPPVPIGIRVDAYIEVGGQAP